MRRLFTCFALMTVLGAAPALADHYEFDKAHTNILFHISHLGYSEMIGLMTDFDGGFQFDPRHPEQSSVNVTLRPSGIRTSSAKLDEVLQGKDWFNAAKFPTIRFVSTSIKVTGDHTGDITGKLTMLGVTRPVVLHVHFNKADYFPMTYEYKAGFSATTTLKRSDFGMTSYLKMIGDKVNIEIQTEGVDLDRKKAESLKHR